MELLRGAVGGWRSEEGAEKEEQEGVIGGKGNWGNRVETVAELLGVGEEQRRGSGGRIGDLG